MRYYFAPMEGLTDSIYRKLHHQVFSGVDAYFMPFISPTIHRCLTHREARELPMADSVPFRAVPQLMTKVAEDFLWAAGELAAMGYREINLNLGCPSSTVICRPPIKPPWLPARPRPHSRYLPRRGTGRKGRKRYNVRTHILPDTWSIPPLLLVSV